LRSLLVTEATSNRNDFITEWKNYSKGAVIRKGKNFTHTHECERISYILRTNTDACVSKKQQFSPQNHHQQQHTSNNAGEKIVEIKFVENFFLFYIFSRRYRFVCGMFLIEVEVH
jgi:hypothetical protein